MRREFTPKLFTLLKEGIGSKQLITDILSGITVGLIALPLAIAFAIASGVSPEKGLITAIVGGLIISALGGSRVQIGGPTGAFIVIVYAIVQQHGVDGLVIATFMAGFITIGFGLARLGNLLKFIPYPLIVGFTSGIAIIIFSSQINDIFGLSLKSMPADFLGKWELYFSNFNHINIYSVVIAVATVLISFNFHRVTRKLPGSIVAILLSVIAVKFFNLPVETIESRFGNIPNHFSIPIPPHVDLATIRALIQPAFTIALLGAIESLLSAVVADGMIGGKHRSNAELVAQGLANIFSAMFGGIPATGAIARTATNVKNGGRTPIAGIVHAIVLLLIMAIFAPYAKLIPMACLAGILVVVAYHMSEWRQFSSLLKGKGGDIIILLVTFFLTVIFDLVIAIEVGVVLSSFILMKRMSEATNISQVVMIAGMEPKHGEHLFDEELSDLPEDVTIYEIEGPLFFGATQLFEETITRAHITPNILVLRMRYVSFIDATGIYRLKEVIKSLKTKGVKIILSGLKHEVRIDLERADIYSELDRNNMFDNIKDAITRAKELLGD
mgnify:CR=1 FL=1